MKRYLAILILLVCSVPSRACFGPGVGYWAYAAEAASLPKIYVKWERSERWAGDALRNAVEHAPQRAIIYVGKGRYDLGGRPIMISTGRAVTIIGDGFERNIFECGDKWEWPPEASGSITVNLSSIGASLSAELSKQLGDK
jgi:hypothetical protein